MNERRDVRQLAAARDAARAKLAGRSPRAVGVEKNQAGLRWVYRWGWSSATIIDAIATPGRRGVAARLLKAGLLEAHPCPGAGGIKGVPLQVLTLTPSGVAEVEATISDEGLLPYPEDGSRLVIWRQLRHDIVVQNATATRMTGSRITEYRTPRELAEKSESGKKQPDGVWLMPDGRRLALELELTAKVGRELDQTVLGILTGIRPAEPERGREAGPFDLVGILSQSSAILNRYRSALTPGATLTTWSRDASRHWQQSGSIKIPAWVSNRVVLEKVTL